MATDNSTASIEGLTESQLIKKFPCDAKPFSVYYCSSEEKFSVNGEDGNPIADAITYDKALRIADALRCSASISIRHYLHEIRMNATTLNTEESRAGAMACMEALRIIDRVAAGDKSGSTLEECWQDEDVSIKAMQYVAGNHGEFMAGFVAVFAEYAHMFIAGGEPNLYVWEPIACMTKEEVKNKRAMAEKFANDYESLKENAE